MSQAQTSISIFLFLLFLLTLGMGIFVVYAIRNGIYPESLIRTIEPEEPQQTAPDAPQKNLEA